MNRFAKLTLAAAATLSLASLAALPAKAEDVSVSLKGKSAEQIKADLYAAASVVCEDAGMKSSVVTDGFSTCVKLVYEDALKKTPTIALPK